MTNTSVGDSVSALQPYETQAPNDPLKLYEGELLIAFGGKTLQIKGTITFEWLPSASVRVHAYLPNEALGNFAMLAAMSSGEEFTLAAPMCRCPAPLHVRSLTSDQLVASLRGSLEIGDGTRLSSAVLHGVNLRNYYSKSSGSGLIGKSVTLKNNEWSIEIDPVNNPDELQAQLDRTGGQAITHWIRVRRTDGKTFNSDQLDQLQTLLYFFLTFAEGRITNAVLPVGFDADHKVVWQQWAPWRTGSWKHVISWVDLHHGEALADSFSGFATRWNEPAWRDAIRIAIQGYAHANRNDADLETGIMLAVMCLDTMAWQRFVLVERVLTEEGFKRLTTADRVRLLCAMCRIPLAFHSNTPELAAIAKRLHWTDLVQAVVEVRNNVIHPDNKLKQKTTDFARAVQEAWNSAMWMSELVILDSIAYLGPTSDRRTISKYVGTLDKLPWDTESTNC